MTKTSNFNTTGETSSKCLIFKFDVTSMNSQLLHVIAQLYLVCQRRGLLNCLTWVTDSLIWKEGLAWQPC